MEKVLLINKPKGITSHDVVQMIRKRFPGEKVGHAGTLDPLATGLLVILIGKATKKQSDYLNLEKEYLAEITLGIETDTYDAEGKITQKAPLKVVQKIQEKDVLGALEGFRGEILQNVPPYSAVKIKGKKLYQLARKGKLDPDTLPKRKIFIKNIECLSFSPFSPQNPLPKLKIRISCSKGTYIRSLAYDLGKKLGCGAFLSELTRTKIGSLGLKDAQNLEKHPKSASLD